MIKKVARFLNYPYEKETINLETFFFGLLFY